MPESDRKAPAMPDRRSIAQGSRRWRGLGLYALRIVLPNRAFPTLSLPFLGLLAPLILFPTWRHGGLAAATPDRPSLVGQAEALVAILGAERDRLTAEKRHLQARIDALVAALADPPAAMPATVAQRTLMDALERRLAHLRSKPENIEVARGQAGRTRLSDFLAAVQNGGVHKPAALPEEGLTPQVSPARTRTNLHFRAGPSTAYQILRTIDAGTAVLILGKVDGTVWRLVWHDGTCGYMSGLWLQQD